MLDNSYNVNYGRESLRNKFRDTQFQSDTVLIELFYNPPQHKL